MEMERTLLHLRGTFVGTSEVMDAMFARILDGDMAVFPALCKNKEVMCREVMSERLNTIDRQADTTPNPHKIK